MSYSVDCYGVAVGINSNSVAAQGRDCVAGRCRNGRAFRQSDQTICQRGRIFRRVDNQIARAVVSVAVDYDGTAREHLADKINRQVGAAVNVDMLNRIGGVSFVFECEFVSIGVQRRINYRGIFFVVAD